MQICMEMERYTVKPFRYNAISEFTRVLLFRITCTNVWRRKLEPDWLGKNLRGDFLIQILGSIWLLHSISVRRIILLRQFSCHFEMHACLVPYIQKKLKYFFHLFSLYIHLPSISSWSFNFPRSFTMSFQRRISVELKHCAALDLRKVSDDEGPTTGSSFPKPEKGKSQLSSWSQVLLALETLSQSVPDSRTFVYSVQDIIDKHFKSVPGFCVLRARVLEYAFWKISSRRM